MRGSATGRERRRKGRTPGCSLPNPTPKDSDMTLKRAVIAAAIHPPGRAPGRRRRPTTPARTGRSSNGTNLVTLVGGPDAPGAISVRFADDPTYALFYENGQRLLRGHPERPGRLRDPRGRYRLLVVLRQPVHADAALRPSQGRQPRVAVDRHERLRDRDLGVTQQVRHVDGSRSLRLTWTVTNNSGATRPVQRVLERRPVRRRQRRGHRRAPGRPAAHAAGHRDRRHQGRPHRADTVVALLRGRLGHRHRPCW